MAKKVIAALVGLYLVGTFAMFGLILSATRSAEEKQRRAIELGELHARIPTAEDRALAEACKGKLTAGSEKSIALYVAKMKWAPTFSESHYHVDQTLVGTRDIFRVDIEDTHFKDGTVEAQLAGRIFKDNLNPVDWAHHYKWAKAGSPDMNDVKYLIVARYESLSTPTVGDDGYSQGSGEYGAKVLTFPTGELICEGKGHVRMKERVAASGHDKDEAKRNAGNLVEFVFTKSVVISPMQELCEAGGTKLCELTKEWVGR